MLCYVDVPSLIPLKLEPSRKVSLPFIDYRSCHNERLSWAKSLPVAIAVRYPITQPLQPNSFETSPGAPSLGSNVDTFIRPVHKRPMGCSSYVVMYALYPHCIMSTDHVCVYARQPKRALPTQSKLVSYPSVKMVDDSPIRAV